MADALYRRSGEDFVPTDATRSPWHAGAQHGGPPTALAVAAIERSAGSEVAVMRLTADLLHEVPVAPLQTAVSVLRSGRKVALHEGLVSAGGRPLVRVTAWTVRRAELTLPEPPDPVPTPPPAPETLRTLDFRFREYDDFFGTALDKRLIAGHLDRPGRAAAWFRLRCAVVEGEVPSPMQRLSAIADSGNGISWTLPFDRFLFVNTDLTVTPYREPTGEWFAMDSVSHLDPSGRGTAFSSLFDTTGWLGRAAQSLYVAER